MDFACLNLVLPCMLSYIKDVIGQKKQEKSNWSSVDHIPLYLGLRGQNDLMYRPTKTALWGQNPKKNSLLNLLQYCFCFMFSFLGP